MHWALSIYQNFNGNVYINTSKTLLNDITSNCKNDSKYRLKNISVDKSSKKNEFI